MERFIEILVELLIILIMHCLGVGFHVMQKVSELDNKYPDLEWKDVFALFLKEDWDTMVISALVWGTQTVIHIIIFVFAPELVASIEYYILWAFGIALLLGYCGQRVVYRFFGSAEKVINKQIDSKLPS